MQKRTSVTDADYVALAELRYRIRCFLSFSEASARTIGLEPQQHQLMLALRGLPAWEEPTIAAIAERLRIQHNSAVELARRSAENGLVEKRAARRDRRAIHLSLTPRGERILESLARAHRAELRGAAPALVEALDALLAGAAT